MGLVGCPQVQVLKKYLEKVRVKSRWVKHGPVPTGAPVREAALFHTGLHSRRFILAKVNMGN